MAPQEEGFQSIVCYPSSGASEHLIEHNHQLNERAFGRFKFCSTVLGLFIGFFVQFSTLGVNFMAISVWGEDVTTKSKGDIVMISLLWSFFSSAMALIFLGFLRNLVLISFNAIHHESEDLLEDAILHMECRFVVGALVGVCLAWIMTDILLGMITQILFSLINLVLVALFWCRAMMWCLTSEKSEKKSIEQPLLDV